MSLDIAWDTITAGSEGEALAEQIRDFVHTKFQQITLPKFINSVHVHTFSFGSACPEVEIKDICDPLPDFYEDDESSDESEDAGSVHVRDSRDQSTNQQQDYAELTAAQPTDNQAPRLNPELITRLAGLDIHGRYSTGVSRTAQSNAGDHFPGLFPRSGTPGIPGGTSNLGYFHLPISGLSGAQTPLAAVASGTTFPQAKWYHDTHSPIAPSNLHGRSVVGAQAARSQQQEPGTRPSNANTIPSPDLGSPFSPSSPENHPKSFPHAEKVSDDPSQDSVSSPPPLHLHPSQPSDLQVVTRVRYEGNVGMTLTAEILLDYPMPSFVGIPLKLSITGVSFDGVAILAYIRKRMHFCFLDPDDAEALVGDQLVDDQRQDIDRGGRRKTVAGLLQEMRVESEIGRKENGKQVLKNVGKVEKFVLEQVRKIFEEEFVFPSYWTFLV